MTKKKKSEYTGKLNEPIKIDLTKTFDRQGRTAYILNTKLSQMATFKRIQVKESDYEKPHIINYYGVNIMSSGSGKDKITREIDQYLLSGFRAYFNSASNEYINKKEAELLETAKKNHPNSENKQFEFTEKEKNKIRNIRFELEEATQEGLFADCVTLHNSGIGSLFIKIPELGLFLENPTQSQQLFLNSVIKLYDGESNIKSTKGESRSTEVKGIPCNCLFYSDTNKLLQDKANNYLMKLLDTGLVRRSFIAFMPEKEISINGDYELELQIKNKAYQEAEEINEFINKTFMAIDKDSEFQMLPETYKIYHNYQNQNKNKYNSLLRKSDDILLKELRGRFWKTFKLSGLIAVISHPEEPVIKPQDLEYAIYQSELFAQDFEQFFKTKPQTDTDKLFLYFLNNKGEWLATQEIKKQKFTNYNHFSRWFDENLQYVKNMAESQGYSVKEEKFNNNSGKRYMLVENKLGQALTVAKPLGEFV
ncbi:MAG: hypothetical protein WCG23_12600 [bacterium]